jgi:hypothetical protein
VASGLLRFVDEETLVFSPKTHWADGTCQLVLSPQELLEKLAAVVPPPRLNLVRYHGVLAPACPDPVTLSSFFLLAGKRQMLRNPRRKFHPQRLHSASWL